MEIETVFPAIERIDDESLAAGVAAAWTIAADDTDTAIEEIETVPWYPPAQRELGLGADAVSLVDHVEDVTECAIGLAEAFAGREYAPDIDVDTVIAGVLVHDISKLYEFEGMEATEIERLLGHPYVGVSPVLRAELPVEMAHIVLSHTPLTTVEPATLEAEIVCRSDEVAAAAIEANVRTDLREG